MYRIWLGWSSQPVQRHALHSIPFHDVLSNKSTGKGGRRGETFTVFSRNCYMCCCPAFREVAEHLPPSGKQSMNFALLVRTAFAFSTKLTLSLSLRLLAFLLFSAWHTGQEGLARGWVDISLLARVNSPQAQIFNNRISPSFPFFFFFWGGGGAWNVRWRN